MALSWPITGEDVCTALKWDTARASEVTDYAEAAVARVERECGPWQGQPITHRLTTRATRAALRLPWPIAHDSVPTVTVDGRAVSPVTPDPDAGLIYGRFPVGQVVVTATARAADTVPDDVILAARYLGAFWAKQEKVGNPSRSSRGTEPDTDVQQGFAMPRRVSEMLRPYILVGGFA
ncbi:hypothetical protein APR04_003799 [Promicromonospora umidemergens]|uniref:PhiE125 gp8 family phage protein n=1 Tax=Promicromonospora umidemergens TaxID=629679 RepID=A0ABP8XI88_9MICO|nr:hypothetical protein [Promicromonospora umidemergens]MCP2284876.1 hypothetical protein [Promicromonospora umidemergens]